jgi:hypothetical protein
VSGTDLYVTGKIATGSLADPAWDGLRFVPMQPTKFKTWIEQFLRTGYRVERETDESKAAQKAWHLAGKPKAGIAPLMAEDVLAEKPKRGPKPAKEFETVFKEQTMHAGHAATVLEAPNFRCGLCRINRILDIPIPILTSEGVVYPQPGYNPKLAIFCNPDAPKIKRIDLNNAKIAIEELHKEFCFKQDDDGQSKCHAIARLLTPYLRGVIGFGEKTPFWFFDGNRPGAGKDYLAGVTQIVYLGEAFEDTPVSENSEETGKRIIAALSAGRRMMHFANCQGHLDDKNFIAAVTNTKMRARRLGSNDANADLELRNELDISISANIGLTVPEDIERRCRKISLEYFEEHENSRNFERPDLHAYVRLNRDVILSAIHTLFVTWWESDAKREKFTFTSFHRWSHVLGNIMAFHGYGNPCRPHKVGLVGGDLKDLWLTALPKQ